MKKLYAVLGLFISVMISLTAVAASAQAPVETLQNVADKMLVSLKKTSGNPVAVRKVVQQVLLPVIDLESMSRATAGRQFWAGATSSQRSEFKKQFVMLVTKTYSVPLSSYTNERIKFYPIRGYDSSQQRVEVKSEIIRDDGPPIPVSYRLVHLSSGWKVYDFSVEGVSMVQSYRSQFADTLRQSGFAGLLKQLAQYNRGQ